MTTTYFFSHNGWSIRDFYDDVYELIRNTPRMEDCYVYVGEDGLDRFDLSGVEWGRWANAWDEYRKDSLNALDWIKKENEELKDELEELKKMNKKNYDEKEKMKAFLGELRINVVKKD